MLIGLLCSIGFYHDVADIGDDGVEWDHHSVLLVVEVVVVLVTDG